MDWITSNKVTFFLCKRTVSHVGVHQKKSAPLSKDKGADELAIHVVLLEHCSAFYRNVLNDERRFRLVQRSF